MRGVSGFIGLLPLFALVVQATPAGAAEPAPAGAGYVVPGTETWELTSASGALYRIFVSVPTDEPPGDGYPVLYLLDGNALFAAFAEARWRLQWDPRWETIGSSIVVGVGYPTDFPYDARRGPDFTSALYQGDPYALLRGGDEGAGDKQSPKVHPGGKDYFLDFLVGPLRSEVARRYSIDLRRQALFGHSWGGLFALHTLYTRPKAFNAIIAASPSIAFNDMKVLEEERAFAERLMSGEISRPARLLVLVGEGEERLIDTWDAEALAPRMRRLSGYGLRFRFDVLEDETHNTVPTRSVTPTLRFAFGAQ